jgi:hypothetical protein
MARPLRKVLEKTPESADQLFERQLDVLLEGWMALVGMGRG